MRYKNRNVVFMLILSIVKHKYVYAQRFSFMVIYNYRYNQGLGHL